MTDIRCEYCGGNNKYDPATSSIRCEHCGRSKQIKINSTPRMFTRKYSLSYSPEQKVVGSRQYMCSTCGATMTFEENDDRQRCPSCGDTSLVSGEKSIYVPDGVVPFAISRERAVEIFQKWIGERKFAPSDLKQMAALGKISGLYAPAWNFNFRIQGSYFADCTYLEEVSDDYTVTRHQYVSDNIDKTYTNVLLSANKRIYDSTFEALSPFEIAQAKPYSSEYLFGFSGLDSDINIHASYEELIKDKKDSIEDSIRNRLKSKYDSIERLNVNVRGRDSSFNYVYLPIWANHYSYKGKRYHCFINGQTGKATGKAPKSFWKILSLVLGIAVAVLVPTVLLISKFA